MSLLIKQFATSFEPAPEGVHAARLIWVIDLGTQTSLYGDKHQILLNFELVNEAISADKNYTVSKYYGASLAKTSMLRSVIVSLLGREPEEIDLRELLGQPCLVTVGHTIKGDATYANILAVTGAPKNMTIAEAKGPLLGYDIDDPDSEAYEMLPQWVRRRISEAKIPKPKIETERLDEGVLKTGIHAGLTAETLPL